MAEGSDSKVRMSYEELAPGCEFPSVEYELSASLISKYLKAVDSSSDELVPPLAIAAYAMTAMSRFLSLPPGAIHVSQELEFFKLVPIGTVINCQAKVVRKVSRGQMRMLMLELNVRDQYGDKVQSGKATVMLPA